jgi:uncharacterized protein YjbI with pentapeptide repeats
MVNDFRNNDHSTRTGRSVTLVAHDEAGHRCASSHVTGPLASVHRDRLGVELSGPKVIKGYRLEPFAQCAGALLDHARLNAANLYSIDLRGASLREAQLAGAHIAEARLSGVDLTGANLTGANLSGADLSRSNLTGADLSGANLRRANLSGARMGGAVLVGARYCKTVMPDLRMNDQHC